MSEFLLETLSKRLTLRHLRLVVAIAEEGNSVRAAKRVNLSQPAVTKSLQEIESLLNVSLFLRTNRGMIPTSYGDALITHSHLILSQIDNAIEEINDLRDGMGGHVSVGTLLAASVSLLPNAIAELHKDRSKVIVSVVESSNDQLLPSLLNGELDLVVGRLAEFRRQKDLVQEPLINEIACVICASNHPLAQSPNLSLADLVDYNWILPRSDTTLRRQVDKAFRDEGVEPPAHEVESVSFVTNLGLILDYGYMGIMPWQTTRIEAVQDQITILPLVLSSTITPIGFTTCARVRLSPAAEIFLQKLRLVADRMEECPFLPNIPSGNIKLK